jgi:Zn-dependent protease with chaperone function
MNESGFSRFGFFTTFVLPLVVAFLLPVFGWWFFRYAERDMDQTVRSSILASIRADEDLTPEERDQLVARWEQVQVSRIMASSNPELAELQEMFAPAATRYSVFRWMKRLSAAAVLTGVLMIVLGLAAAGASLHSQSAQYWSLRAMWLLLRPFAVFQVIAQATLLGMLSFWVTALLSQSYYIKLIAVAVVVGGIAVFSLLKAIFTKTERKFEVDGRRLSREQAPELWARIDAMAARLGTAPPDQIIVGIEANFFVTEVPVTLKDEVLTGRTLYVSLSLLRVMTQEEADGVLAHELAHFSGSDTHYGSRTGPLLKRFAHYLDALYSGGLSRLAFYYLVFFWGMFQLTAGRNSRLREFRADRLGSELSSPQAMAGSLVKIAGYCTYQSKVEKELALKQDVVLVANISERLALGFTDSLGTQLREGTLEANRFPHPFDSHPPITARLTALGLDPAAVMRDETVLAPVASSWLDAIIDGHQLEADLWGEYERGFSEYHRKALAWRLIPENAEQLEVVKTAFPDLTFTCLKDRFEITHEGLRHSEWPDALTFREITNLSVSESTLGGKRLEIMFRRGDLSKVQMREFRYDDFRSGALDLLTELNRYYGRHHSAVEFIEGLRKMQEAEAT